MVQNKHQLFHFHRIHDASSVWLSESSTIADSAVTFFQGLLIDKDSQFQPKDCSFIHSLITKEDNVDLCMIPDIKEVLQVVFFLLTLIALQDLMVSIVDFINRVWI